MPERELVHQSERRTTKDRNLAAGLQRTTSAQFVELLAAGRVCTDSSGDEGMRKASAALLEQGTQTPSPAPDLSWPHQAIVARRGSLYRHRDSPCGGRYAPHPRCR